MSGKKVPILLDTDIGSDIDDAICLAYLLAQEDSNLLGITTVSGEPERRAMLASAICRNAGEEIPIYPGTAEPLIIDQKQERAPQAEKLESWEHESKFPEGEHIDFLRRTIRERPGEITLLAIGPLTNIALLFKTDPEIPKLLDRLVMMCGYFETKKGEWNAICDPHAASIVYATPIKVHRSIGLDVTTKVTMDRDIVEDEFQSNLLGPVLDFSRVWFKNRDKITFHDPLAAATLFDDEICSFEKGNIEVELRDEKMMGYTLWKPDREGKQEVALGVDSERFFEHFFSKFE